MVTSNRLAVKWDRGAYVAFQRIFDFIYRNSPANAEKVREEILLITKSLSDYPERFPPDKFKKNNKGNYRAFEKYSYRVTYQFTEKEIRILRIRHVKQEPLAF